MVLEVRIEVTFGEWGQASGAGRKPVLSLSRGERLILKAREKQLAAPHRAVCSSRTADLSVQGQVLTCAS